jgi:hypothetical protein
MGLKMDKKAIVFTILAISIITLFLITYTFYSVVKSRESINKRITTLNSYVFSIERDIPRELYISGFRIIFLLENKIIDTGAYINNFDSVFKEAFFNGTVGGTFEPLMEGATFLNISESINNIASRINAQASLANPVITVDQEDPWNVRINLTCNLLVEDNSGLAMWNKTASFIVKVPIENFEDPVYVIDTGGLLTNKINKTHYKPFRTGTDVSNLTKHLENSFYTESSIAPSFLKRIRGDLSADPQGIESLVYLPDLSAQGIEVNDKTCVDYIYFDPSNEPTSYKIQGMSSWFKLDDNHLSIYNVSGLEY